MNKIVVTLSIIVSILIAPFASFIAIAQTIPMTNAGFEQAGTTGTDASGWTVYQGGYQRTTSTSRTGSASIQVTNTSQSSMAGAYQRVNLNQTSVKPVFIGGYVKGQNISMAPGSFFGASIYAEIYFTDGTIAYWNSVPNTGTFDWTWVGFNTGSGFTTATNLIKVTKPISYILVVPVLGNASGTAYFDDIQVEEYTPSQSAITLMFDDGYASDITIAKPILDQYGFKASAAIATGLIGTEDHLTWDQVRTLSQGGWNINSHTVNHIDLTTLSSAQADDEQRQSKDTLAAQGYTIKSIAYPFGAYNGAIVSQSQKYYTSARSFELGDNPMGVFPYNVKVRPVTNTTTVSDVNTWINEAKSGKRWTIIAFHNIATSGEDQYYTSQATFSSIIAAIAASGVPVVNYDQALQVFKTGGGGTLPTPTPIPTPTPATANLKLTTYLINDNGGSLHPQDFEIYIGNQRVVSGATTAVAPGTYTVRQVNKPGYTPTPWAGDCAANGTITLKAGDNKMCYNSNNDNAPTNPNPTPTPTPNPSSGKLKVTVYTINDNGGSLNPQNFELYINNQRVISGSVTTLTPGTYTVRQVNRPGYTAGSWKGDCAANGTITIKANDNKSCYIDNNDNAPTTPTNPTASWSTSISATATNLGQPINSSGTIKTNVATSGLNVHIEMFDQAGVRKSQKVFSNQSFTANQVRTFASAWTPPVRGTYTVKILVYNKDWTKVIAHGSQVSVTVR